MSYLNHGHDPARRAKALVAVGAIHAAIGYVLITGLGAEIVDRLAPPPLVGTNIPLPPPPPIEDDPPPPEVDKHPMPTAPLPPIPIPRDPPQTPREVFEEEDTTFTNLPTGRGEVAVPQDPPRALFTPRKARPSNNQARWITNDDYPARALRAEAEGVAGYRLIVSTNGQVSACEVTRSTGNGQLDDATCDFIVRRARFEPATDESGAKVVGSYTGTVKWEIPE